VRGEPPTEGWAVVSGRSDQGVTERHRAFIDCNKARPLCRFEIAELEQAAACAPARAGTRRQPALTNLLRSEVGARRGNRSLGKRHLAETLKTSPQMTKSRPKRPQMGNWSEVFRERAA
jgi:hypothetical protein